jgi:ADP-heptose:LPS heptosyltransferase
MISSDTAPVHIASAMGAPVVGLYGPNTPFLYGPSGDNNLVFYHQIPCSPCLTNTNRKLSKCSFARCMDGITVGEVAAGIEMKYFGRGGELKAAFKKSREPAATALLRGGVRSP